MDRRMSRDLDNYITGHYGEDQFREEKMIKRTEEQLNEEMVNHLQLAIRNKEFFLGENFNAKCSCEICQHIRGKLILNYYEWNGYLPENKEELNPFEERVERTDENER